jgi:glycosyltransferase involved in cell wall biosynthesis
LHHLISSAFPLSITGYGAQTLLMMKMFGELGHSVSVVCWNLKAPRVGPFRFREVFEMTPNAIPAPRIARTDPALLDLLRGARYYACPYPGYPRLLQSTQPLDQVIAAERPDLVVFHQDIFPFHGLPNRFAAETLCCLPLHYRPIEWNTRAAMAVFDRFAGLCDFGVDLIREARPEAPCRKVPLCFDPGTFFPLSDRGEVAALRKRLGLPADRFVCLIIGNNTEANNRKAFDVQIRAFANLHRRHPDAFLYLHTQMQGAVNLFDLIRDSGLPPGSYAHVDQALREHNRFLARDIADLYRCVDVLLFASKAEGFGVPIVEAQAVGCPVITTQFSSMPELTFNGICTDYREKEYRDDCDSYWVRPSVENVTAALLEIHGWSEAQGARMRQAGIEGVRAYTTDTVKSIWQELFQQIGTPRGPT